MSILAISEDDFEREIATFCDALKQAARKARCETQELWLKWEQDRILDPLTPDPLSPIELYVRIAILYTVLTQASTGL